MNAELPHWVCRPRLVIGSRIVRVSKLFGGSKEQWERTVIVDGADAIFYSQTLDQQIVVPEGYESDGGSIPRRLWDWYSPFGPALWGFVFHDLYCDRGAEGKSELSYKQAAALMAEVGLVEGDKPFHSKVKQKAVEWFGPTF